MRKHILLIFSLVFIAGCIGQRPVSIEANNGLKITEFSADPRTAEYSDSVLFSVGVENVGGTTARNAKLTLFGLQNIWLTSSNGQSLGEISYNFNNAEFDPPLAQQNRPGDLKIFSKAYWPPVLPEGVEQDFPVTARVTYDYSTTGSIIVPTISKSLLKIKNDKGEVVESSPRVTNSDGPLKIGLSKGTLPIVVDGSLGGDQDATFVLEFINVGDGFPVTEVSGSTKLGLLQGSISVFGPGVLFDPTESCLGIPRTSDTRIDFTSANIDLLKLRSNGRLPMACTIRIQRDKFTPTTSGIITFSVDMKYRYFVEKSTNVHVIGTKTISSTPTSSSATPTPTPTPTPSGSLSASPSYRRVFATSDEFTGNIGGAAGADALCQVAANNANLGGTWKAWISTSSENAKARITDAQYKLLDGTVVANSKTDLTDGTIEAPINRNEKNVQISVDSIWTGTIDDGTIAKDGTTFLNCNGWTDSTSASDGVAGSSLVKDFKWTNSAREKCDTRHRLYCFEQGSQGQVESPG